MEPGQKKVSNQQLLAKKYIEENDLDRIISEMLNALVHERVKQPLVYMIKFLAGLMSEEERKQNGLVIPEPFPKGRPIAKFPYLTKDSLLKKYLSKELFTAIKYKKTKQGGNINNIIKLCETLPDDQIGCQITDGDCLETFKDLLIPIINEYHNIDREYEYQKNEATINQNSFPFSSSTYKNINKFTFQVSRNIKDTPYDIICSNDKLEYVSNELVKDIQSLIDSKNLPQLKYITYSKETITQWDRILNYIDYKDDLKSKLQQRNNWPNHRGIYYLEDLSMIILINFSEHLQFYCSYDKTIHQENIDLVKLFNTMKEYEKVIGTKVPFDYSKQYGYLNSDVRLLGAGMKLSADITIKQLKDEYTDKKFEDIIKGLKFDEYQLGNIDGDGKSIIKCSSCFKLNQKDEIFFIEQFYNNISGLIHLNKESTNENNKLIFAQKQFELHFSPYDTNVKTSYENSYEEEKDKISSSGLNINDIISYYITSPENVYGIFLEDYSQLKTFYSFIKNYLSLTQGYGNKELFFNEVTNNTQLTLVEKNQIENVHICLIRNIDSFPFANSYINSNKEVEELITTSLTKLNLREHFGSYFSFDVENQKDQAKKIIEENNLSFYNENMNISNRGVIQFDYENVYAVVNDIDHIKFYLNVNKPGDKFNDYLFNVLKVLNEFSKQVKFATDKNFGVVTSCPKFLGTGLVIKITIRVKMYKESIDKIFKEANEKLIKDSKIKEFSYEIIGDSVEGRTIVVRNEITSGKTENQILSDLGFFLDYVLTQEKKNNEGNNE